MLEGIFHSLIGLNIWQNIIPFNLVEIPLHQLNECFRMREVSESQRYLFDRKVR